MLSPKKATVSQARPVPSSIGTTHSVRSTAFVTSPPRALHIPAEESEDKVSASSPKRASPKPEQKPSPKGLVPKTPSRGAYESPHSPIASAKRTGVARTTPKVSVRPAPSPMNKGLTSPTAQRRPDGYGDNVGVSTPLHQHHHQPPASPVSPGQTITPSNLGSPSAVEVKAEDAPQKTTLFSPAYLRHLEERREAAKAKKNKFKTKQSPKANGQGQEQDMDEDYALEEDEFDPFLFIKNLPPLPPRKNVKVCLPKKSKKAPPISLALDLDETLVHCSVQPMERAELTFSVNFNGMDYEVYVRTRPHLKEFLETVSEWFEVIIFTASQKVYADKLLNILDPERKHIHHRVFRDSCVCVEGNYLKDLTVLGRELKKVAIVDNSVQAFGFQLDNGIPIESWFDQDDDQELLNLIPFLKTLKDVNDVRPLIRNTFRLQEFVNSL